MSIIVEEKEEGEAERRRRTERTHMGSRAEITDSEVYVLWLARQKGRVAYMIDTH